MTLLKKAAALATATLIGLASASPAFAALSITISDNGVLSNSTVTLDDTDSNTVSQTNSEAISTDITTADSDTGDNEASSNTGTGVTISTGTADTEATVTNGASRNDIMITTAASVLADAVVLVDNNGDSATQNVSLTASRTRPRTQSRTGSRSTTLGTVRARTGRNTTNSNTGGTVSVTTEQADTTTTVTNDGHTNILTE